MKKKVFVEDLHMETQTVFYANGDINIRPFGFELDKHIVSGGNSTSQKGMGQNEAVTWKKTTELGVDLKTYLLKDARMQPGREYTGVLKRDRALNENGYDDNHYTFVEMAHRRAGLKSRYLYRGKCINLLQREDGTLFLTYRWPKLSEAYTFLDFCSEAINEIYIAASLARKEDETKRSGLVKKD